ncbi:DUF1801 domain-containing protein [Fulvivirgaceae bacterium BMA10]|uniref:DUF1801 domain-containing protein n=1 Tax=Splendidivirga corallicola TaxID=3051826 RepID=A0ABT8KPK5_9BACT|nr:DUF1801 domain-containing protein [Fulvivirgaceae bacterium BMA10]
MAEAKTKPTDKDVVNFINAVPNETRRKDGFFILDLMKKITKLEPVMWGPSIIGFGFYHYKYKSGHEGDSALMAFSPRKQNLVLYVLTNFENQEELLQRLGKHKTGKICLYINKLSDVNIEVLEEIINKAWDKVKHKIQ